MTFIFHAISNLCKWNGNIGAEHSVGNNRDNSYGNDGEDCGVSTLFPNQDETHGYSGIPDWIAVETIAHITSEVPKATTQLSINCYNWYHGC